MKLGCRVRSSRVAMIVHFQKSEVRDGKRMSPPFMVRIVLRVRE